MRSTFDDRLTAGKSGLSRHTERCVLAWERALLERPAARSILTTAATGTFRTIWVSGDLSRNTVVRVIAHVHGANAAQAAYARYTLDGLFGRMTAGVAVIGAVTVVVSNESAAGFDAQLIATSNEIVLQVRDDGVATMNWVAFTEVLP